MPIALRTGIDAITIRSAARKSKMAPTSAPARLGGDLLGFEPDGARPGRVTVQIVRDWVVKFNASEPEGLIDRKAAGEPPLLNATHLAAPVVAIEREPISAAHGAVRWRIINQAQMLSDNFSASVSRPTLSSELRAGLPATIRAA